MQKDIILITTKNVKTGVKRVENELVEEWERMGCTVSKVTQRGEILYDSFAENNVNNLQKGSKKSITKYYYRFFALRRMFKAHNGASVVALALPADCFAGLLSIFTRKRVIVSERNDPRQYPNSKMYRILRDFCFCLADTCIFQTNDAMRCFNKRVQKKGVVIPNPINQELEKFEWKRNNNNVIAVGRLNTQKNYPMLLRAFSIFSSCHPEYKLEIYGDGALEEELKKQCADLKIESKVYFKGFVSKRKGTEQRRQRINREIQHCDRRQHDLHQDPENETDPECAEFSVGNCNDADHCIKQIRCDAEDLHIRHDADLV